MAGARIKFFKKRPPFGGRFQNAGRILLGGSLSLGGGGLILALLALLNGVGHHTGDQLDGTDSVIVAGDDVVDLVGS